MPEADAPSSRAGFVGRALSPNGSWPSMLDFATSPASSFWLAGSPDFSSAAGFPRMILPKVRSLICSPMTCLIIIFWNRDKTISAFLVRQSEPIFCSPSFRAVASSTGMSIQTSNCRNSTPGSYMGLFGVNSFARLAAVAAPALEFTDPVHVRTCLSFCFLFLDIVVSIKTTRRSPTFR